MPPNTCTNWVPSHLQLYKAVLPGAHTQRYTCYYPVQISTTDSARAEQVTRNGCKRAMDIDHVEYDECQERAVMLHRVDVLKNHRRSDSCIGPSHDRIKRPRSIGNRPGSIFMQHGEAAGPCARTLSSCESLEDWADDHSSIRERPTTNPGFSFALEAP